MLARRVRTLVGMRPPFPRLAWRERTARAIQPEPVPPLPEPAPDPAPQHHLPHLPGQPDPIPTPDPDDNFPALRSLR
jgi:hypothetical protein